MALPVLKVFVVFHIDVAKVAFRAGTSAQALVVLSLHYVVEAAGYALVTTHVIREECNRYHCPHTTIYVVLVHDWATVLIYHTGAAYALRIDIVVARIYFVVLLVCVAIA